MHPLLDDWFTRDFGNPAVAGLAAVLAAVFAGLSLIWIVGSWYVSRRLTMRSARNELVNRLTEEYFSTKMGIQIGPGELNVWRMHLTELPEGPTAAWMNDRLAASRVPWRVGGNWRWDR